MTKYILTCSIDGIKIDYETIVNTNDFWTCYEIAEKHGCYYFTVCKLEA